ncbi:MAG: hypothetical protein AAF495_12225 [Pseudomonadota bacterium]
MAAGHFDRVIFADWSAASSPGPRQPAPDSCWVAWGTVERRPAPRYCRTRAAAEHFIKELAHEAMAAGERCLIGFDFVFGLPWKIGPAGGRPLARLLKARIEDGPDNANNRFAVAAALNADWSPDRPGPFWMCPAAEAGPHLTVKKPGLAGRPHGEYRIVDRRLRAAGKLVQSVWKLGGVGAVGGQSLVGLAAVARLLDDPVLAPRAGVWPFETVWARRLADFTIIEAWPGMVASDGQPYAVKDARQVAALRDHALGLQARGKLRSWLARPVGINRTEERIAMSHEGWIFGA